MAPLVIRSNSGTARRPLGPAQGKPPLPPLPFGLPRPGPGMPELPAGISLCMIVKDEERFIEMCLRSVAAHVDEICIVDTGSTDRTLEIAARFGARVVHRPWRDDFAWARNEALKMATKRWILVLDADEELDAVSHEVLRTMRTVPAALSGIWLRCQNLSDDYKGTGASSHALVRFFPNNARLRYKSAVHEYITLDELATGIDAKNSPLSITHHGYLSEIVALRQKSQRNLVLVKAAAKNDPEESFNWYNLGTTSILCGDNDGAIEAFEKMRLIIADTPRGFQPNALTQLAELYSFRGEYERAIECVKEALRYAPRFANAHFALGKALGFAGRPLEARAAFQECIADDAYAALQFVVDDEVSTWKAQSEIGSSYGNAGDNLTALEWFDRALVNRPLVVPVRLNRARALEGLERYADAAAVLKALADEEPGDTYSVIYINFLLRRNEITAAVEAIEAALAATTPRMQASLLCVAAKLAERSGIGDARAYLERAVAAHAGAAEALDALEALYRSGGDSAAVERLLFAELSAPMTVAADYARRASRYLKLGLPADAEIVSNAGLEIAPSDAYLRYNLGAALVQTGRKELALDELSRAGSDGDIGLRAMFLRAIVLGDLGRHAEALAAIDGVLAAAPDQVDAHLQRFRFATALGSDVEAESTLRAALDLGDSRVAAELATWLLHKGRFADAQAVAERALQPA
jgi:tetratricopeptide (TPR) repeat protein